MWNLALFPTTEAAVRQATKSVAVTQPRKFQQRWKPQSCLHVPICALMLVMANMASSVELLHSAVVLVQIAEGIIATMWNLALFPTTEVGARQATKSAAVTQLLKLHMCSKAMPMLSADLNMPGAVLSLRCSSLPLSSEVFGHFQPPTDSGWMFFLLLCGG